MNAHACLFHAHVFCSRYMRAYACVMGKGKREREIKGKQRERKKAGKKRLWQEGQKGRVGAGEVDEGWTPEVVKRSCRAKAGSSRCARKTKTNVQSAIQETQASANWWHYDRHKVMDEKIVRLTQTKEQTTKPVQLPAQHFAGLSYGV